MATLKKPHYDEQLMLEAIRQADLVAAERVPTDADADPKHISDGAAERYERISSGTDPLTNAKLKFRKYIMGLGLEFAAYVAAVMDWGREVTGKSYDFTGSVEHMKNTFKDPAVIAGWMSDKSQLADYLRKGDSRLRKAASS